MSKRKKGKVYTDKQAVKPDTSQPQSTNDNETQQADHYHKENHANGDATKKTFRNVSKISDSKNFQHNPDNVKDYFKTGEKIKQTFDTAKNVPDNHLKNSITGELGELATEQNLYAQRGNDRVKIHDSKTGGKKNNGVDHVATKGERTAAIETKSTRVERTFELTKTKTQGEQMSPQWMQAKIREMWSSTETAPTAALLSSQPYTKYISGVDVDYGTQTVRLVTDPNRYKPLPQDVGILDSAKAASHGEMYAMRTLNTVGEVTSYIAITMDAAQILGQLHHDFKKKNWTLSGTFRLVIEKGAGYVGGLVAVGALNAGTDFIGIGGSLVAGAAGYDVGQDLGSDFADTLGLAPVDDEERERDTRDGMNIIAGEAGVALLDGVETAAGTISDGLSSGCEVLNDTLPFEVCSPGAQTTSLPQSAAPQETYSATDNIEPNSSTPANPDNSTQSSDVNSSTPEPVNASYPSDSGQLTSEPEKSASENSQGFHARRVSIMQSSEANSEPDKDSAMNDTTNNSANNSLSESQNIQSSEKPLGFHARRLEIMKSHAENRSTPENSQATDPKCEAPVNSKNQSVLNDTEEKSTYESPRPSPF